MQTCSLASMMLVASSKLSSSFVCAFREEFFPTLILFTHRFKRFLQNILQLVFILKFLVFLLQSDKSCIKCFEKLLILHFRGKQEFFLQKIHKQFIESFYL